MTPLGWSPFVTVKDNDGTGISALLAPEAKGVLVAVSDKDEIIVAMVTTSRPLGDILGQVVSAGGNALPTLLQSLGRGRSGPEQAEKQEGSAGKEESEEQAESEESGGESSE